MSLQLCVSLVAVAIRSACVRGRVGVARATWATTVWRRFPVKATARSRSPTASASVTTAGAARTDTANVHERIGGCPVSIVSIRQNLFYSLKVLLTILTTVKLSFIKDCP